MKSNTTSFRRTPFHRAPQLLLLVLLACMSGCQALFGEAGLFPSQQSEYLDATESLPIEVPDTIGSHSSGDQYPIPTLELSSVLPEKFEIPRVDSLGETESRGSVRIQKLLEDRWILVNRSPTQTWPLVLDFLADNQVGIAAQRAAEGYIETDWLKSESNREALERYRFVFTNGVQAETTEVLVKHFATTREKPVEPDSWSRSTSEVREENMANLLAQHLASSPDTASHSLLAQGLSTANKANIEYDEQGRPFIALQLPYQRGWASVGLALKKASFTVEDVNRELGKYYADFTPGKKKQKKERGFFSRLFFPRSDKLEEATGEYQIVVERTETEDLISVAIVRDGGQPLANNEQAFLLNRILSQLT